MNKMRANESIKNKEIFINDVLKEDLKRLDIKLQKINADISELIQEKHTLKVITNKETHPNGFKTQVNLGCNFFMEAAVLNTSKMLMNIGLDHYLELSLSEAYKYLDSRIWALEKNAEEIRTKIIEIKAHIKLIMLSMTEPTARKGDKS